MSTLKNAMNRRYFLQQTGLAAVAIGISPLFLSRSVQALVNASTSTAAGRKKVFVLIIQRGAMDGLSLVVPTSDPYYLQNSPAIGLKAQGDEALLRLDGNFGLHPAMASLKPYWDNRNLAFVHQVGSPDATRSHFDAQDFLEAGTPGDKNTADGFLNRALIAEGGDRLPLRAIALQPSMPRVLQGTYPAISMNSLRDFDIRGGNADQKEVKGFESMYQEATDSVFRGVGREVFDSLKSVNGIHKNGDQGNYPKSGISNRLREIADLIKADLGMQVAVTDMGGWDTHVNQGNGKGQLSDRFKELSEGLAAFAKDLGPRFQDVVVATVTEFGRTVKENGTRGTDHGHGSVMMVLGDGVNGGKVHGQWKELKAENLYEGRDLPVTTDHRDIFSEILSTHLGLNQPSQLASVFPRYKEDQAKWRRILKA
jgi:uncharacterized protein (DUF1501 family)